MGASYIPVRIKLQLWGKAGGRCEYDGCNEILWRDDLTKAEFNVAYIAHIVSDSPDGPRGDVELSEKLKADLENLMLLCDHHHRMIDKAQVIEHPRERLMNMKQDHERRINLVTSIHQDRRSHILLYGANIGKYRVSLNWQTAAVAMVPEWFPYDTWPIDIGLSNSAITDIDEKFWEMEQEHLRIQFNDFVKSGMDSGRIDHVSVFALAPQPLLIELGRLLSDISSVEVYQHHREPVGQIWSWDDTSDPVSFDIKAPKKYEGTPAIILSLSADIDEKRVLDVLDSPITIWKMQIKTPRLDFLRSREQLMEFRYRYRELLNLIKSKHGEHETIHLFPAVPNSIAVEIGRVWMPKADLPMVIYDQNRDLGGFINALSIGEEK